MHDANHSSFSRHRWLNRALAYTSDALGASSWLWRIQHNTLHHGNANVVGFDADIALAPFARLAPSQPWRPWYRAQHIYMWPLYGFLALKNLLVSDLVAIVTGRLDRQPLRAAAARRASSSASCSASSPISAGPSSSRCCSTRGGRCWPSTWRAPGSSVSCWRSCSSSPTASTSPRCTTTRPRLAAARTSPCTSCSTTADIDVPPPGRRARVPVPRRRARSPDRTSPRVRACRTRCIRRVAKRFREACSANGITYHLHPGVWSALRSHTRWLRAMSIRPA